MQVNHRKVHNYLGMTLHYTTNGQMKITMMDYIDEILDAFDTADLTGGGNKSTTAISLIFKVTEECEKLNSKKAI